MTAITNIEGSERILAHLHEGRLVQGVWHDEDGGREFACLLGAIAPTISAAIDCPSSVMPAWLARLVVTLFDGQAKADALAWAGRFGTQMARWHVLGDSSWFRVWESFCRACVADARRSARAAEAAAYAAAAAAHASAASASAAAVAARAAEAAANASANAVNAANAAEAAAYAAAYAAAAAATASANAAYAAYAAYAAARQA
ncbi:MAG: hypothetical protein INH34_14805, partial [Phycisphaerales bacterium]|nr:hypothetical protein [Phycisphaerales bacterium]